MSTETLSPPVPRLADLRKRWTIAEFDRLVNDGFIREGSRAYLWDFEIIEPMSENPPHVNAVANLLELLKALFPKTDWTVNQDAPLVLREGYKPQPDISVLRGPRSKFEDVSPSAAEAVLLIEVSNTSYPDDSADFLREYAASRIACYWIVNIPARRVEVYEDPIAPDAGTFMYEKRTDYGIDAVVPVDVTHEGVRVTGEVAVIEILRNSLGGAGGKGRA